MTRSGRDEPMWIVIHICMEATLGIFLYCYLYLKSAKMLCLSYYLLCFLFNKLEKRENRFCLDARRIRKKQREGRGGGRGGSNNVYTYE
jgi:hypothetical protein